MTRINSAIPVRSLTDEHLLAEHREIKRLPSCYLKAKTSGALQRIPKKFCLGTGHVTFFLDKFAFSMTRYMTIHKECEERGFNVPDYSPLWKVVERNSCWRNYEPTEEERKLLVERISERIQNSPKEFFHYFGERITKERAIELLTKES